MILEGIKAISSVFLGFVYLEISICRTESIRARRWWKLLVLPNPEVVLQGEEGALEMNEAPQATDVPASPREPDGNALPSERTQGPPREAPHYRLQSQGTAGLSRGGQGPKIRYRPQA